MFTNPVAAQPLAPTNVSASVLTPRSVEVTWTVSSSPDVTGYSVTYSTNAEYIEGDDRFGQVIVSGNTTTRGTLNNLLEENTEYAIGVRAIDGNNVFSVRPTLVLITTYTDGK